MADDYYAKALGMASKEILTRLFQVMIDKGVITHAEAELILSDAETDLRLKGTEFADAASAIPQLIREAL
jgi:hypothetical protein